MPFTPKDWEDSPDTSTPITAAELERIEAGIQSATSTAEGAATTASGAASAASSASTAASAAQADIDGHQAGGAGSNVHPASAIDLVPDLDGLLNGATQLQQALAILDAAESRAVVGQAVWKFSTTTAMADPGAGFFRLNHATLASATAMAISETDHGEGLDLSAGLARVKAGDELIVASRGRPQFYGSWVRFTVTSVTDNGTWRQIGLTFVSQGSSGLSNNAQMLLHFTHVSATGGGGGGGAVTWSSSAPSGGSSGDEWYRYGSTAPGHYFNESGTWVLRERFPALFVESPLLKTAPWNPNRNGSHVDVSTATVAELFNGAAPTGITKSSTLLTLAASAAVNATVPGASGGTVVFNFPALPTSTIAVTLGNGFVQFLCSPAGVATIDIFGSPVYTFPFTVSSSANNRFVLRLLPGALMFAQMTSNTLKASDFYPFVAYVGGGAVAWGLTGQGTINIEALEFNA